MLDQATQHGYFNRRSMTDLIFNTPEGQRWYIDMISRGLPESEIHIQDS